MVEKCEGLPVCFSVGHVLDKSNPEYDRVNYIKIRHLGGYEQTYLVDKSLTLLTIEKEDQVAFEFISNERKNFYKIVSIRYCK